MRSALISLKLALAFLTILPVQSQSDAPTEAQLKASRFAYPIVGLLIGLLLAGLSEALTTISAPAGISAFLLLALSAGITGGLHLDGLADTCDGLFLTATPERRLEVMRDPRAGSFGVAGIVLILLGQYAALASLAGHTRSLALIAAAGISRTLILAAAGAAPYARASGTGQWLIDPNRRTEAAAATLLALIIGSALLHGAGLASAFVAICVGAGLIYLANRRLGGITGDILGALVELAELAVLVTLGIVPPILSR